MKEPNVELDYTELSFLFCKVHELEKSGNSQTERILWNNIAIKLENAITKIDKAVVSSTNTEFTSENIGFIDPEKPYDPNWMNKTEKL